LIKFLKSKFIPLIEFYFEEKYELVIFDKRKKLCSYLEKNNDILFFCFDAANESESEFLVKVYKKFKINNLILCTRKKVNAGIYINEQIFPNALLMFDREGKKEMGESNEDSIKRFIRIQFSELEKSKPGFTITEANSKIHHFPYIGDIFYIKNDVNRRNIKASENKINYMYMINPRPNVSTITLYTKRNIKELQEKLKGTFLLCRRDTLVNKQYITGIDSKNSCIILCNGLFKIKTSREQAKKLSILFN